MEDLLQNPDDNIEIEPADLGPEFMAVLTSTLAKQLANELEKPWTEDNESEMQEKISAFIATARERDLKTIRVVVTQANGDKRKQELDIDRISKTRSLQ